MRTLDTEHGEAYLYFSHYQSTGRTAIELIDATDFSPIARCTTNLEKVPCSEFDVFIKNWSENIGLDRLLEDEQIIGPCLRTIPHPQMQAGVPVHEFLISNPSQWNRWAELDFQARTELQGQPSAVDWFQSLSTDQQRIDRNALDQAIHDWCVHGLEIPQSGDMEMEALFIAYRKAARQLEQINAYQLAELHIIFDQLHQVVFDSSPNHGSDAERESQEWLKEQISLLHDQAHASPICRDRLRQNGWDIEEPEFPLERVLTIDHSAFQQITAFLRNQGAVDLSHERSESRIALSFSAEKPVFDAALKLSAEAFEAQARRTSGGQREV